MGGRTHVALTVAYDGSGFHGFAAPGVLRVTNLDCASFTPLLDIKPYLPTTDAEPGASMGWLAPHATPRAG